MSVKSGRQAFSFYLDTAVVVVIEIFNELLFEVIQGFRLLQIEQLKM